MHIAQQKEYIISWLILSGAQVAHLPISIIDGNLVRCAHDRELFIHGANLNSEDEIRQGLDVEIDQFSTDNLELALRVCRNTNGR